MLENHLVSLEGQMGTIKALQMFQPNQLVHIYLSKRNPETTAYLNMSPQVIHPDRLSLVAS